MAQSVKPDYNEWTQFDHHAYQIIDEDFVHENYLTVDVNILSAKGRIRLQQVLKTRENGSITTTGETNIWFPIQGSRSLYMQYRAKGFRLHFDNGIVKKGGKQVNFYGSWEASRIMSNSLVKVGMEVFDANTRVNLRLRHSGEDNCLTSYAKIRHDHKNWTIECLKAFNWCSRSLLLNSLLIGYTRKDETYNLRHEHSAWDNTKDITQPSKLADYMGSLFFNYTRIIDSNRRIGIQTGMSYEREFLGVQAAFEKYEPSSEQTLKLRVSSDLSAAASIRNKIGNYGSYVFGVGLTQIGTTNKVQFGCQLDLNL